MTIDRSSLPPNVRRWLNYSLPLDSIPTGKIRNKQEGEMEIRGRWTSFMASTLYESKPFTFRWQARLRLLPGVWITAEDWHDSANGGGNAKMWGLIPMGGRHDLKAFRMQVVRNLAELPWKPLFALSMPDLTWQDTDESAFMVRLETNNEEFVVRFQLNDKGEVVQASSLRHYDVPGGYIEVPWQVDYSDYQQFEGVFLPSKAAATYQKKDGPWTYWRGQIVAG